MGHHERISELAERAADIGSSLRAVCRLARVSQSNLSRWQRPDSNPTTKALDHALTAIETQLERLEKAALERLAARHGAPTAERNAA